MNLSLIPASPAANHRTSPLAKVYTNDGRSIPVPIHPVQSTTCVNCSHSPERQFIRWFGRQSAADRGFPIMVKSILFVNPGTSNCTACNQSLSRFLQRFGLAHKLNIRNVSPQPACSCKKNNRPIQTELDQLLNGNAQDSEDEWYKRLAAPFLAGVLTFASPNDSVAKPIIDTTKAWVQHSKEEQERRRKLEEDAAALRKQAKKTQQEVSERRVLDEIMAGEFELEQEFTAQDVISPCIDVHAQYAIQRMLKSPDPMIRQDGTEMLAAVKAGKLNGIYKEDQRVPASWARRVQSFWWKLIPPGKDAKALLFRSAEKPEKPVFIMIVFRNSVRSNPQRLDPALRDEWRFMKAFIDRRPTIPNASCLNELN